MLNWWYSFIRQQNTVNGSSIVDRYQQIVSVSWFMFLCLILPHVSHSELVFSYFFFFEIRLLVRWTDIDVLQILRSKLNFGWRELLPRLLKTLDGKHLSADLSIWVPMSYAIIRGYTLVSVKNSRYLYTTFNDEFYSANKICGFEFLRDT